MEELYRHLPLADLTRIVLNRRQVTPAARTVYTERRTLATRCSQILGFLAAESSVLLTFPRYPDFYVAFTREPCPLEFPAFVHSDQRDYPLTALCYLGTRYEVSSAEDARSLLRLHWNELEEPYLVKQDNDGLQAVWAYPCNTVGEYLQTCARLCYDDYFELFQGPVERFQTLLAA